MKNIHWKIVFHNGNVKTYKSLEEASDRFKMNISQLYRIYQTGAEHDEIKSITKVIIHEKEKSNSDEKPNLNELLIQLLTLINNINKIYKIKL